MPLSAMILAAGRGERMRPLTDHRPKPLLQAGGAPLIVWHLRRLAAAGIREIVINHAHLGYMIEAELADGRQWGLNIRYSAETEALETAGGIVKALPLLGAEPFLVINGDVFTDWPLTRAHTLRQQMQYAGLRAWCVLIDNPEHNPQGDFGLHSGLLQNTSARRFTYAGIGLFDPSLFAGCVAGEKAKLAPLLRAAADQRRAGAEHFGGQWVDVGTPQRLAELDQTLRQAASSSCS